MSNEDKALVDVKSVYGNERIYPICENAKIFAQMLGQETLTRRDLNYMEKLGYKIQTVRKDLNGNVVSEAA